MSHTFSGTYRGESFTCNDLPQIQSFCASLDQHYRDLETQLLVASRRRDEIEYGIFAIDGMRHLDEDEFGGYDPDADMAESLSSLEEVMEDIRELQLLLKKMESGHNLFDRCR